MMKVEVHSSTVYYVEKMIVHYTDRPTSKTMARYREVLYKMLYKYKHIHQEFQSEFRFTFLKELLGIFRKMQDVSHSSEN